MAVSKRTMQASRVNENTNHLSSCARILLRPMQKWTVLAGFLLLIQPATIQAQTAGEGTISGTVTDSTGAVVSGATVTATNAATNISTERTSSTSGRFTIAPVPPGIYSVQVVANGFKTLRQDSLSVDALGTLTFNPVMSLGEATETVIVTSAPCGIGHRQRDAGHRNGEYDLQQSTDSDEYGYFRPT